MDYFLALDDGVVKDMDWKKFFAARSISYTGEVMASPRTLTWRQMAPGLPPAAFCGRIDALELAEGAVRDMLLNPEGSMIPEGKCPRIPPLVEYTSMPMRFRVWVDSSWREAYWGSWNPRRFWF